MKIVTKSRKNKLFNEESNNLLRKYMKEYGHYRNRFVKISELIPEFTPKQLSNNWRNFLDPRLSTEPLSNSEKEFISKWILRKRTTWNDIIRWKELRIELVKRFNKTRSENDLKKFWYAKTRKDVSAMKKCSKLSKPFFDDETYHQRRNFSNIFPLEPQFNLISPKHNEPFKMNPVN